MNQILHIFKKDVRRLWPEILVSLAALAAFVWLYPQEWGISRGFALQNRWLTGGSLGLVVVGWVLMIARVVHGETLVGDRQFWITRPYRWPRLLAAKALFLFVFLLVPFFAVQLAFLRICGFPAMPYLLSIGWNVGFIVAIAVIPLVAIATMTKSFGKMLLGLLVVIAYTALVAFIDTRLPTSGFDYYWIGMFTLFAFEAILITVIGLQYARRRTVVSKSLTVGVSLTIALLTLFGPENLSMRLAYPERADSNAVSVEVAFKPATLEQKQEVTVFPAAREVDMTVPLGIAGIPGDTAIQADYGRLELVSASGEHWISHWQDLHEIWGQRTTEVAPSFKVSDAFYERAKGKPVTVALTLAMTGLEGGKTIYTELPKGDLTIPGGMRCGHEFGSCLAPLRLPGLMLASVRYSHMNCSAGQPRDSEGGSGGTWLGTLNSSVDFGLTPVTSTYLNFKPEDNGRGHYLCDGAPLSFTPYKSVWRAQKTINVGAIRLEDYVFGPWAFHY